MNENNVSTYKLVSIILIAIGVFVMFLAYDQYKSSKSVTKDMTPTTGVVTNVTANQSGFVGKSTYRVEYAYSVDGFEYTFFENIKTNNRPVIGDTVTIWYRTSYPALAMSQQKSQVPWTLIFVGGFFAMGGVVVMLLTVQASQHVVLLLLGVIMVLMGFGVPLVADIGVGGAVFFAFGLLGIVILYKSFLGFTNQKGSDADRKIDEFFDNLNDFGNKHM